KGGKGASKIQALARRACGCLRAVVVLAGECRQATWKRPRSGSLLRSQVRAPCRPARADASGHHKVSAAAVRSGNARLSPGAAPVRWGPLNEGLAPTYEGAEGLADPVGGARRRALRIACGRPPGRAGIRTRFRCDLARNGLPGPTIQQLVG